MHSRKNGGLAGRRLLLLIRKDDRIRQLFLLTGFITEQMVVFHRMMVL